MTTQLKMLPFQALEHCQHQLHQEVNCLTPTSVLHMVQFVSVGDSKLNIELDIERGLRSPFFIVLLKNCKFAAWIQEST